MDKESSETGSRFRIVILTVFKCVFICMSTPERGRETSKKNISKSCVGGSALKHTCDCPMHHRSIFKLDSHSLIVQFHQKPENNGLVFSRLLTRLQYGTRRGKKKRNVAIFLDSLYDILPLVISSKLLTERAS